MEGDLSRLGKVHFAIIGRLSMEEPLSARDKSRLHVIRLIFVQRIDNVRSSGGQSLAEDLSADTVRVLMFRYEYADALPLFMVKRFSPKPADILIRFKYSSIICPLTLHGALPCLHFHFS